MAKKVPSHYCCNYIAFSQCFLAGVSEVREVSIKSVYKRKLTGIG